MHLGYRDRVHDLAVLAVRHHQLRAAQHAELLGEVARLDLDGSWNS